MSTAEISLTGSGHALSADWTLALQREQRCRLARMSEGAVPRRPPQPASLVSADLPPGVPESRGRRAASDPRVAPPRRVAKKRSCTTAATSERTGSILLRRRRDRSCGDCSETRFLVGRTGRATAPRPPGALDSRRRLADPKGTPDRVRLGTKRVLDQRSPSRGVRSWHIPSRPGRRPTPPRLSYASSVRSTSNVGPEYSPVDSRSGRASAAIAEQVREDG